MNRTNDSNNVNPTNSNINLRQGLNEHRQRRILHSSSNYFQNAANAHTRRLAFAGSIFVLLFAIMLPILVFVVFENIF